MDTLREVARVADVRLDWLMTNEGEPGSFADSGVRTRSDSEVEAVEAAACPSRVPLLAALRARNFDPGVVAAIAAERPPTDPGEEYWWGRIAYYMDRLAALEGSRRSDRAPTPTPPTQLPPPKTARK